MTCLKTGAFPIRRVNWYRIRTQMKTTHTIRYENATAIAGLPADSVELVVTSPPYPMIEMWDGVFSSQDDRIGEALAREHGADSFGYMHEVLDGVWSECFRALVPGGFMCVNIGDATRKLGDNFRLYSNHSRITQHCSRIGFQSLPVVIWRKQTNAPNKFMGSGMLPSGAYVTLEHEYVLIFRKGDKRVFDTAGRDRRRRSAFFWEERNSWFSDIWDFKGVRQALGDEKVRRRSGAFPFELAYRLINMYSCKGDTVVDPFLGTGTVTAAGVACARNTVGFEVDAAFAPIVERSVSQAPTVGNAALGQRVRAHMEFVRRRSEEGKPLQYTNGPHGFPVMTKQETDLELERVEGVDRRPDAGPGAPGIAVYEARHRGIGGCATIEDAQQLALPGSSGSPDSPGPDEAAEPSDTPGQGELFP
ncbi:MAG: DNA-methyltransferase [Spirochaetia bacterium]